MRPARSQYSSFPEDPSSFLCPDSSKGEIVVALPLQPEETEYAMAVVVCPLGLHRFELVVIEGKALVVHGVFPKDMSQDVSQLETGPDIRDAN